MYCVTVYLASGNIKIIDNTTTTATTRTRVRYSSCDVNEALGPPPPPPPPAAAAAAAAAAVNDDRFMTDGPRDASHPPSTRLATESSTLNAATARPPATPFFTRLR